MCVDVDDNIKTDRASTCIHSSTGNTSGFLTWIPPIWHPFREGRDELHRQPVWGFAPLWLNVSKRQSKWTRVKTWFGLRFSP